MSQTDFKKCMKCKAKEYITIELERSGKPNRNEIGKRLDWVGALHCGEGLEPEVAAVAGEPDPKVEFVCCFDRVHL